MLRKWRRFPLIYQWCFQLVYHWAPTKYFAGALRYWNKARPESIEACEKVFGPLNPYGWWPLILHHWARQYASKGGLHTWPHTKPYENALLRHAAQQGERPGAFHDSLVTFGQLHAEAVTTNQGRERLKQALAPLLKGNTRLAGILDIDDLVQEAVSISFEAIQDPTPSWAFTHRWPSSSIRPTRSFLRRVVARIAAPRYGADCQI